MKVLIVGGTGFLGAWLCRRFLAGGHEVRILDRNEDMTIVNEIASPEAGQIDLVIGDITVMDDIVRASAGCDAIVHLAALLGPVCNANPHLGLAVNVGGTLNVFEAARQNGIGRVVYASSAAVFGGPDGRTPFPTNLYGTFKVACEGLARSYVQHGISSVGFRPLTVYGPGRIAGGSAGPSIACRMAVEGKPYVVPFRGPTDMIYVDDVAAAFEAGAVRSFEGAHVFNLPGEMTTVEDVIAEILRVVPGAPVDAQGEHKPFAAELEEHDMSEVLGDLPRTSLRDGIGQTVAFYRERLENSGKA